MGENRVADNINDRGKNDVTENEPLVQNPEILLKKELIKFSGKMAELKTSLQSLKQTRVLAANLENK